MDDEKKSTTMSSLFNFSKYSITTIHILVELICFLVIFLYIRRNVRRLQNQIDDLTSIIQQQQEMLHTHHKLLNNHPIITISEKTDNISYIFNIPFQKDPSPPPSQTIIPSPPEQEELKQDPPLTSEDIEQELVNEIQELKEEEEKHLSEDDSPSKKKNRRRH